ncbi:hypothetical protein B0H13DRAFT_2496157 [Mycena leptocephala]|nr:hypothetical protein B0H13DRAFT_2496157 [Mycena leptocephala]
MCSPDLQSPLQTISKQERTSEDKFNKSRKTPPSFGTNRPNDGSEPNINKPFVFPSMSSLDLGSLAASLPDTSQSAPLHHPNSYTTELDSVCVPPQLRRKLHLNTPRTQGMRPAQEEVNLDTDMAHSLQGHEVDLDVELGFAALQGGPRAHAIDLLRRRQAQSTSLPTQDDVSRARDGLISFVTSKEQGERVEYAFTDIYHEAATYDVIFFLRDVTLLILFASNPNQFYWTIRHFIFHYSSQFSCGTSVGVVAAAVLEMSCPSLSRSHDHFNVVPAELILVLSPPISALTLHIIALTGPVSFKSSSPSYSIPPHGYPANRSGPHLQASHLKTALPSVFHPRRSAPAAPTHFSPQRGAGNTETARLLPDAGTSLTAKYVSLLPDCGVPIGEYDGTSQTALRRACAQGQLPLVREPWFEFHGWFRGWRRSKIVLWSA